MAMREPGIPGSEQDRRRRGVRRTVFVLAVIALLVYLGFISTGVLSR